jgi:hypothetical protein
MNHTLNTIALVLGFTMTMLIGSACNGRDTAEPTGSTTVPACLLVDGSTECADAGDDAPHP